MITIHGRTRCQFYKGQADWQGIAAVKRAVSIPVIANGDIVDSRSARRALALSGADGVMIGRGARGRPWLPAQVAHAIYSSRKPDVPKGAALRALIQAHYDRMLRFYGSALGLRVARKHLGWYMDAAGTGSAARRQVLTAETPGATLRALDLAFSEPVGATA
jgi:tRNA-dihydrouridine synthase